MTRAGAIVLLSLYLGAVTVAAVAGGGPLEHRGGHRRAISHIEGLTIQQWHGRAVRNRRTINRLRRVLLADPHVVEAINLSCATFGFCSTLWRKARCETGGTFDPRARNPASAATGLFQFLVSTWNTTPYRVFDRDSPYANALAAGWMHANGRGNEWECG